MIASIFELPELTAMVAEYLNPHAILKCMLVSRTFYSLFDTLLYRKIIISPIRQHRSIRYRELERKIRSFTNDRSRFSSTVRHHLADMRELEIHIFAGSFLNTIMAKSEKNTRKSCTKTSSASDHVSVESVVIDVPSSSNMTTATACTVLRRLKLSPRQEHAIKPNACPNNNILLLLCQNPRLSELCLSSHILMRNESTERLLNVLKEGLPCLERLEFLAAEHGYVSLESALLLVHTCLDLGALEELECSFHLEFVNEVNIKIRDVAELEEPAWRLWQTLIGDRSHISTPSSRSSPESRIRTLLLPANFPMKVQAHVLRTRVPSLTKFSLPIIRPAYMDSLASAICDYCLSLQELVIGDEYDEMDDELFAEVAPILDACTGSRGGYNQRALKSFHTHRFVDDERVMHALLKHSGTLKELVLKTVERISSFNVQRLLSTCSELTRFSTSNSSSGEPALHFNDAIEAPWACAKLRFLILTLSPYFRSATFIEDDEVKKTVQQKCLQLFYIRIGALKELEELELDFDNGDNRLAHESGSIVTLPTALWVGFGLEQLQGLKKLRRIKLGYDIWSSIGMAECEFMAREWPLLDEIELDTSWKPYYWKTCRRDPWRWLKNKRPNIRITSAGTYPLR